MKTLLPLALGLAALGCSGSANPNDSGADRTPPFDAQEGIDAQSEMDVPVAMDAQGTDAQGTDAQVPPDAPPASDTCRGTEERAWKADPRLCLVRFSTDLPAPRGMAIAPNGDIFVVARGTSTIVVLYDADGDGVSMASERSVFATQSGLNHGIAFSPDGQYVYASSSTTVYRWRYTTGMRTAMGSAERVVVNMPSGGSHPVRPLAFDTMGRLYVSVGSASNLDTTMALLSTRSMIRRFTLPASLPMGGIDYATGEVYASGLRNEVGITFDSMGRMWGVENGRDNVRDATGDVHTDNPAEEINLLSEGATRFFGYPSCWTEFRLSGGSGPGTQHGDIEVTGSARHDDAWCRNPANVHPPAFAMQAHWAPLGITEYTGSVLPWRGSLFLTSHGSWNRDPPVGRLIARATVAADGTISAVEPIIGESAMDGSLRQGVWRVRPVDIRQGADGALYFSDDNGGSVYRIGYR